MTTLQLKAANEQARQFDQQMAVSIQQFMDQLGLTEMLHDEEMGAEKYKAVAGVIASLAGAWGQIRASGNSIFGGGTSNSNPNNPFGLPFSVTSQSGGYRIDPRELVYG